MLLPFFHEWFKIVAGYILFLKTLMFFSFCHWSEFPWKQPLPAEVQYIAVIFTSFNLPFLRFTTNSVIYSAISLFLITYRDAINYNAFTYMTISLGACADSSQTYLICFSICICVPFERVLICAWSASVFYLLIITSAFSNYFIVKKFKKITLTIIIFNLYWRYYIQICTSV